MIPLHVDDAEFLRGFTGTADLPAGAALRMLAIADRLDPPAPALSPTDAERWRDFRHAAAEALDAAGIDGASRVVMNLPMPPAPPTDDGGAAFAEAVDALAEAQYDAGKCAGSGDCGSPYFHPRACDAARAALIAAHAAAVADAYALGASVEREASTCACGEPLGELCYACNDDARETEADPPALVNGGPPRDALDDGR